MSDTTESAKPKTEPRVPIAMHAKPRATSQGAFLTAADATTLTNAAVMVVHFGKPVVAMALKPEAKLARLALREILGKPTSNSAAKRIASAFMGEAKKLQGPARTRGSIGQTKRWIEILRDQSATASFTPSVRVSANAPRTLRVGVPAKKK